MRSVGLKVLKNRLSEYIRIAASGEVVLVTDRDRVVAELIPPRAGPRASVDDAFLAEAFRRGIATPPRRPGQGPPPRAPMVSWKQLEADSQADREDR
jgi:prevent-host-death family protein